VSPNDKKKFFSDFYDKHINSVYRFIYLKVSSREVSQDLTAEAFKRLWESIQAPTEIKNPRAFLYQIARNLIIDHYRKKGREPMKVQPEELEIESQEKGPSEQAEEGEEMDKVRQALSGLKDNYQNVLIWYYLDEISIEEIAELEGKSENAVRVTIHRGLEKLRKKMGISEEKPEDRQPDALL